MALGSGFDTPCFQGSNNGGVMRGPIGSPTHGKTQSAGVVLSAIGCLLSSFVHQECNILVAEVRGTRNHTRVLLREKGMH